MSLVSFREAEARRIRAVAAEGAVPSFSDQAPNGDERRYRRLDGRPSYDASFSKGLPHDSDGVVDEQAYQALRDALHSGRAASFAGIGAGKAGPLAGPPLVFLECLLQ